MYISTRLYDTKTLIVWYMIHHVRSYTVHAISVFILFYLFYRVCLYYISIFECRSRFFLPLSLYIYIYISFSLSLFLFIHTYIHICIHGLATVGLCRSAPPLGREPSARATAQTRGKGNEPASSPNNSEGGIGSPLPGGRCCSPEGVRVCVHQSLK